MELQARHHHSGRLAIRSADRAMDECRMECHLLEAPVRDRLTAGAAIGLDLFAEDLEQAARQARNSTQSCL